MHDIYQQQLDKALELHKQGKLSEAEPIYNALLNRMPFEEAVTYLLSDLYLRKEYNGLGINLLSSLLQNNPNHAGAWCNLGCAFRKENDYERAKSAWLNALRVGGETEPLCNNFATLYADRANPQMALQWIDRALKIDPNNAKAHWGKALALLTLREWSEGWQHYEWRQKIDTWDFRPKVEAPIWNGSPIGHLYLHGEQGVGDEIMFLSALPLLLRSGMVRAITLELNAKVAGVAKQTWQNLRVVKHETPGKYDAKLPIGSLIRMFGINSKPYLQPHSGKVAHYRAELEKMGPGPYVALTWIGGMKQTRVEDRSMQLQDLAPIMDRYTCVSAQYHLDNHFIESERHKVGLRKINDESAGGDLHDQAALFKAVDAVVTVQQTAVHVAGGVGAKTFAMIGSMPHWRYGLKGDSLPWYESVKLYRKKDDWAEVIERVLNDLDHCGIQRAKQEAA